MAFGRFIGEVHTEWLVQPGEDRDMRLLQDFAYVDPDGKTWTAKKNAVIDGASIPDELWATVGSPYTGDYRRASVLHDFYCDTRTEPHEAVHLMFYYAMRCDGVSAAQANIMYYAVRMFGPKWAKPAPVREGVAPSRAKPKLLKQAAPKIEEVVKALDAILGEKTP